MILHLHKNISNTEAAELAKTVKAEWFEQQDSYVFITSSSVKTVPDALQAHLQDSWVFPNDMQLSARSYGEQTRAIQLADDVVIGGTTGNTVVITGPCSVESPDQIEKAAGLCQQLGVKLLRGGAYKPRTSPYSFQGLGKEGLQLLRKTGDKYGLKVITEARDATHIDEVIEYSDIVQIGAKAMYDQGILRRCGEIKKPVLLKRGFGSTLQEFVQAAEFVLSGGNPNVILCERGIRTFESKTRFTLDLCGVSWLKAHTNLPIIVDPSHAMGYAFGVPDLTRAATAMGIDGLLIETHINPAVAKSDAAQQLDFETFTALYKSLMPVASAVGRSIV